MRTAAIALAVLALTGCASPELPELQTGVQCVQTKDGKAIVTDSGIEVVKPGRCVAWRVGPTKRESAGAIPRDLIPRALRLP